MSDIKESSFALDKSYYKCSSCLGKNDVKLLNSGNNGIYSTASFRLCKDCRKLLVNLFIDEIEAEDDE
jgi:hypothetical protein